MFEVIAVPTKKWYEAPVPAAAGKVTVQPSALLSTIVLPESSSTPVVAPKTVSAVIDLIGLNTAPSNLILPLIILFPSPAIIFSPNNVPL